MKRTEFTYGQLDKVLRALGFSCRPSEKVPPGRIYEHKRTGALVKLPTFPDKKKVFEYHLITVQGELENFGIADPTSFDKKLQKVG
jgi:hypothetical protein